MPDPKRFKDKKHWMEKCLHQVLHVEKKKNRSQGLAICLNRWRERHKKMANTVANKFINSSNKQADYPDHPDSIVVSKGELWGGSKPISELDIWNYYSGVSSKMLPELKGRNLFIAVKPEGVLKKGQKPIYIRHPYDKKT